MDIYFSSDWHYGHTNMVRGVSRWLDTTACRNFDTLEEHNETLISNINKTVKEDDILYFMGDFAFGGFENIPIFRKAINCKTIHLTLGNHDHHIHNNKILKVDDKYINAQNLFKTVNKVITKTINGQPMVLGHYPLRSWENASKGSWMLFGHCHGTLYPYLTTILPPDGNYMEAEEKYYKTMDVGIDTTPEFRPYHFDELAAIMKERINLNVDHHYARH